MNPNTEDAKGRAKEALGALTGDEDLKAEGAADQAAAHAHRILDNVADAAKDAIDKVRDALK